MSYLPTILAYYRTHQALRPLIARSPFRYTVRFGTLGMTPNRVQINLPEAIRNAADKKLSKECFDRAGVKTAPWRHGNANGLPFPVVAKHRMGSRGTGVYRLCSASEVATFLRQRGDGSNAPEFIFERFKGYSREYRLHVTEEGCFKASRKLRRDGSPDRWKFSDGVWITEENPAFHRPANWAEIEAECVKALKSCGLDFGACDVKYSRNTGKFFVIEINSAPGLDGEGTQRAYLEMLPRVSQRKFNQLNA